MDNWCVIRRADSGEVLVPRAYWCRSFWCHLRGLMFRRALPEDQALLFVYRRANRVDAAIHMFFVFFPIAAVWLDDDRRVISGTLARPWRPYYAPARPARYLIEAHPRLLERVQPGDTLSFQD